MKARTSQARGRWLVVTALATMVAACGSSTGGNGGSGGAGTGTGGSGGQCHGDATAWQALTAGPFACTKNSDCCVIVNGCLSESQIVAAAKKDEAKAAWPYCDSSCNLCIAPAIEVACDNGTCAGTVVDLPDASPDLMQDHCGVDGTTMVTPTKLHFTCGD